MSDVANLEGARIMMDTDKDRAMILHYGGQVYKFEECIDGLYYLDICSLNNDKTTITNYSYLATTVTDNKQSYTKWDVVGAKAARSWQHIIAWPGNNAYHNII